MRPLWILLRVRLAEIAGPGAAAVVFGLPVALMLLTGAVFGRGHPFERRGVALVGAPAAVEAMRARLAPFPELRAEGAGDEATARRQLVTRGVEAVVLDDGAGVRLLVSSRNQLLGRALSGACGAARVEVVEVPPASYLHYLFPGLVTWTIIVDGLLGMGYGLARHRRSNLLRKLATTPLSPAQYVGAQILGRTLQALAQILLMVAAARIGFGLALGPAEVAWLAALALLGLLVFVALGFLIACFVANEAVLMDAVNAGTVVIVLVSEVFFSTADLPAWIAGPAAALPSTQLVRLLRAVVLHGRTSPSDLLPGVAVLAAWGLVAGALCVKAFRWR